MADATISLGLDPSQFETGLNRAMQSAQGFGGRMGGVLSHPYAIAAVAAFGLARAGLQAREEADKLRLSVSKLTSNTGGGLFREIKEIDTSIAELTKKFEELDRAARPVTLGGLLSKELSQDPAEFRLPFTQGSTDRDIATDKQRVLQAISQELDAQVVKQKALTALAHESFEGSERDAAIQKVMLAYKEKIGDIDEKYAGVPGGGPARNKLQEEAAAQNILDLKTINRKYDLLQKEQEMESKLGGLATSNLSIEQQRLVALRERVALLRATFAAGGTQEQQVATGIKLGEADVALAKAEYAFKQKSPAQRQAEANEQRKFQQFLTERERTGGLENPHFDMSGNLIGGRDPVTGEAVKMKAKSGLGELNRHMDKPGHMKAYGGSDDFNDFFHPTRATGDEEEAQPASAKDPSVSVLNEIKGLLENLQSKVGTA